jgi:uncharacterized membrane protein YcaP (DUF421 family)
VDGILRAAAIYIILFLLFRIFGKRTLAQVTTFDFVLLLVVGEATQQALLGEDFSITQAFLVIATLIVLERTWDLLSWRYPRFRRVVESQPLILMKDGRCDQLAMSRAQVTEEDILQAARKNQGLERMDQIKHVVLEPSGGLSIIPRG